MKLVNHTQPARTATVLTGALLLATFLTAPPAAAQDYPPPPNFSQGQIDSLVSRIALYPDPLLAQIFAAASFPDQIPEAAQWANQYRNLRGDQLADVIYQANLPFDPAVQALVPFPSVLDMMARDMNWTSALGNAVLADRPALMDAIQRMRRSAEEYGYLRSNAQMRVYDSGAGIEIAPVDPGLIYVPTYDPYVVYAPPRPGFYIGSAIGFDSCYSIGAFGGWGWGGGFNWYNHVVVVNHSPWGRTWYNRDAYVHNYGNWDRGNWRNTYVVNRNVTINNGGGYGRDRGFYGNQGGYSDRGRGYGNSQQNVYAGNGYRGGSQPVQQAPAYQNRGYGNSQQNVYSGNGYRGGSQPGQQQTPAYQNRGNGGGAYNGSNGYRGAQQAPVPQAPVQQTPAYQNRSYGGSAYNGSNGYRGAQQAPVPQAPVQQTPAYQNRSYGGGGYNGSSGYRGAQQAPANQNRTYSAPQQSGYQGRGFSQPQAAQSRSYGAPQQSGYQGRGFSQPQAAQSQSYSAPQQQSRGSGGFRGNESGHAERGGFGGRR